MRFFHWPAAFAPFVEDALEGIDLAIRSKNDHAMRKTDLTRTGHMTIAVVPDAAIEQGMGDSERNARLVALLGRTDIEFFSSRRRDAHSVTLAGHDPITGKTVLACLEGILDIEDGKIGVLDLDAREAGDHLHVMGAAR